MFKDQDIITVNVDEMDMGVKTPAVTMQYSAYYAIEALFESSLAASQNELYSPRAARGRRVQSGGGAGGLLHYVPSCSQSGRRSLNFCCATSLSQNLSRNRLDWAWTTRKNTE